MNIPYSSVIYVLVIMLSIISLTGCDAAISTVKQVEAIKACDSAGLQWKQRRSMWDGDVTSIECSQPDYYAVSKEQITYDSCISSNIKYVFTDMDITRLEEFCSSESLQSGK